MGVVAKQSYNILSVIIAFGIGAINTIVFYLEQWEGCMALWLFPLAQSNILQPIFSYGVQHTIIKYFSAATTQEQDKLLLFSLFIH